MRYFFNFKTSKNVEKFNGRELFYMRLLNKRMGKCYFLHKNKCPIPHQHIGENHLQGYVIEFESKEAFAKFKLGFKKLFNPNINPSEHIVSIVSFTIDNDVDFVKKVKEAYNDYIKEYNRYRSYVSLSYSLDNISSALTNMLSYCNDIIDVDLVDQHILKNDLSDFVHQVENCNAKKLTLPKLSVDLSSYCDRYYENYNNCFENLTWHSL